LNNGIFAIQPINDNLLTQYIGGKGLAAHLLTELNPAGVDPLAPDNSLLFLTGPVCGSMIWGSCRYGVYAKSPQTGLFAESYAGGRTPEAIDATGFDVIIIQGSAVEPSVIETDL
jgi:aldehyde:ferredoxin oxidoreductase